MLRNESAQVNPDLAAAAAQEKAATYEKHLQHYRKTLAFLQHEQPGCLDRMPGISPGELEERERSVVEEMTRISYSNRYSDATHQYRHVILPKGIAKWLPHRLMSEAEWRSLGVIQSPGWVHYMIHEPEPHILLFKRPLDP